MAKAAELKDEKIIAALLDTGSVTAASKICGVTTHLIYRRLKQPEFAKKYAAASRELLKTHTAALQCATGEAIQALREIVADKLIAPSVRASAAAELMRNSLKFTEVVDLLGEIEALESEDMDT